MDNNNRAVTEIYAVYAEQHDMTFVMESVMVDGDLRSLECIGWYCGEPDDASTKQFGNRQMKATY